MLKSLITQFRSKVGKKHIITLILLLSTVLLIGVSNYFFASSSYQLIVDPETAEATGRQWVGDIDGLLMSLFISAIVAAVWFIFTCTGQMDKLFSGLAGKVRGVKENPKKLFCHVGILAVLIALSVLAEMAVSSIEASGGALNVYRILFFSISGISVYCIILFRGKPTKLFLSLSLLIGFLYITLHPNFLYAWDNRIHYKWALEESFVINVSVSESDAVIMGIPELEPFELSSSQESATVSSYSLIPDTAFQLALRVYNLYKRVAHIPTGVMLFIGRSLALAPDIIFRLGMAANHLIYTFIVYLAIKRLNSGKHLMAIIAMFPMAFVLSTTYGYDHWVTAFTMLGFAYFFNEVQNSGKSIELKNIIIMIGAFVLGLGPKAIYVSLMFVLYFLQRDKFKTIKDHKRYNIITTFAILFVVASFAIPFVYLGGGGAGDTRGGAGVNASSQTSFILRNPLTFAGILLRFMKNYLRVFITDNFVTYFAHLGSSSYSLLTLALTGFVTLTDRNEHDLHSSTARYKIIISIIAFVTVALYSTGLYIEFTEVGTSYIVGVQPRYLMPVLFPLLYVAGSLKIKNNMNKAAYSGVVFGIISFVLLVGAWEILLPHVL